MEAWHFNLYLCGALFVPVLFANCSSSVQPKIANVCFTILSLDSEDKYTSIFGWSIRIRKFIVLKDTTFQAIAKALEGIYLDSGKELHRVIRVSTVTSVSALHQQLHTLLPGLRSPWGALLLLFSLLLSRGLVSVSFKEFLISCGTLWPTVIWLNIG